MVSLTTERGEPSATSSRDRRCDGNSLDVGDGRGTAEESDIGRERRLQSGLALLALNGFDEGCLFTADVGTGASVQIDVKVVAGSAGVLSDETGGIGLVDGLLNVRCFLVEFTSDVDVGLIASQLGASIDNGVKLTSRGVHGSTGHQTTLDQLVRVASHNLSVLAGSRFTLIRIDDQVPRSLVLFPSRLVHERPLETGRESGTTSTSQTGVLNLLNNPRVALEQDLLGLVPVTARLSACRDVNCCA